MNRKEFLQTSASLIPLSVLGLSSAEATPASHGSAPLYATASANESSTALKFNANGKFKIVQFTDVHWVPSKSQSEVAAERMAEVLDAEKPDLVIFTGDVVYGSPAKEALDKAFAPVRARKIPFTYTFGNHDDEQDMTRQEIYDYTRKWEGNLSGSVEGLSGVSNFVIPIKSADGKKNAFALYHFDSHSYPKEKSLGDYDWIKADQIEWYRKQSEAFKAANGNEPLTSLSFFHIPLPEYNQAAQSEDALLIGIRKETACGPRINSGLFSAMIEQGDMMGVFVGHDHVNDYLTRWKGILLGYGRYTGGKTVYCDIPGGNGARIIELTEGKQELETWIRLKGGKVIEHVYYPNDFSKDPW